MCGGGGGSMEPAFQMCVCVCVCVSILRIMCFGSNIVSSKAQDYGNYYVCVVCSNSEFGRLKKEQVFYAFC